VYYNNSANKGKRNMQIIVVQEVQGFAEVLVHALAAHKQKRPSLRLDRWNVKTDANQINWSW
jgi:hypothetical protein